MRFSLLPTFRTDAVTHLTPQMLQEKGIDLLMLDFDNTIVPYTTNAPTEQMSAWLREMVASAVSVCIVSNSRKDRVKVFCSTYGVDCITHAKKPFPNGIRRCLKQYGLHPQQCALAGDQIFTDVMGARGCGVQAILVRAIHNHNIWLKLRHVAEMPFICLAGNRRLEK